MKLKTIIFDFDGVIADSFAIAHETASMRYPDLTQEELRSFFSGNINEIKKKKEPVNSVDFQEEYAKKFEGIGMESHVDETIRELCSKYQMFIVSSTRTKTIHDYLVRHEIRDCFSEILGNDVHASKVAKFNMIFEKYGLTSDDCLFVTDTLGDIKEGREVGLRSVAITTGYQRREVLQSGKPFAIIDSLNELMEIVKNEES